MTQKIYQCSKCGEGISDIKPLEKCILCDAPLILIEEIPEEESDFPFHLLEEASYR